ncbi:MAG TPA: hypothetical protein VMB51_09045 [Solirubrobacteraceae bacterium]|nr:hypothetical protein [Solirubrobacteraceae bacterium]
MRSIRTLGITLLALCALGALMASTAAAKEKPVLKLSTKGKGLLSAGAEVKASSSNLVFVTSAGDLECTENVLNGTLTNNSAKKDKASVTSESSTGKEAEGDCKTSTLLGRTKIKAGDFPWTQELETNGKGSTKGSKKVLFESVFPEAGNIVCIFEASKVADTFKPGAAGSPTAVTLTVTNQVFKRSKKGSNAACPTEGKLSGSFELTSSGETIDSEL